MSVDNRLQYLWKPQLVEAEPPSQQVPPSIASQGHTQGSDDPSPHEPLPRVGVGYPIGSIAPTEEAEARAQRAEYRDERRLCVEIIALVVGFFGLVGLLLALYESRLATEAALQSMVIAGRQMELSERPWVTVVDVKQDYARTSFAINGLGRFEVSLKNVGHSMATEISARIDMMVYPSPTKFPFPHPGPVEMDKRVKDLCESMRIWDASRTHGLVLFPEQQGIVKTDWIVSQGEIEDKAFEHPPEPGKFVDIYLIGCVAYKSTFTILWPHITRFIYRVSSAIHQDGYFRVGEKVLASDVRLSPFTYSGDYID